MIGVGRSVSHASLCWHLIVLPILTAGSAHAQASGAASRAFTLAGIVTNAAKEPIVGAEVRLLFADSIASVTRTGDDGRFVARSERGTPNRLTIRRMGFLQREIPLSSAADSSGGLTIVLAETAANLAEIDVVAREEELGGWLRDFSSRRRTNSFGRYFARDEIKSAGKHHTSEMLRTIPGVALMAARRFGYVVRMRGCRHAPMVWLDGMRVPGAEVDDVSKPEDIAAMEVYTSAAGVPAQFLDRSNNGCGTILVWTRHQ